ncbi:MAG: hypothetical protein M3068_06145 [Gemmatimonadota bacterium]|nr:hypothetical protein [Gemmatimonadota bacterium]
MPIVPLYGHSALKLRLHESMQRNRLPSSLLIQGPPGIGKQRLALWLGQLLLCTGEGTRPCGECSDCRLTRELAHPDLRWFFPRMRLTDADVTAAEVLDHYAEAIAERVERCGLYPKPSGSEGIFVPAVHALVHIAARTPALARRKVLVIGDADRMVPQEGTEAAANAFLKLLEEPLPNTTIVLTSSEPSALLPTVRSRVVVVRAFPLPEADVRAFLADPLVGKALGDGKLAVPASVDERVAMAAGAPGRLFRASAIATARRIAGSLLEAATAGPAERARAALERGSNKARGEFSDALDELAELLSERMRGSLHRSDIQAARLAAEAIDEVERAKERAGGNVNPQLLSASLLRMLSGQR